MEKTKEKGKRRSKKDSNGREFVCSCGKTYLSYPALYTHMKTKHEGVKSVNSLVSPSLTCNSAFEIYLREKKGEEKYVKAIENLRMCLNERGYQMEKEKGEADYCSVKKPENIPKMINFYLIKFLPYKLNEFDLPQATEMMKEFCDWLFQNNHTKLVLTKFKSPNEAIKPLNNH
jgi:hypothetical protein